MACIVFVHGTGVRAESYDATFDVVSEAVRKRRPLWEVERCYWGEPHGVRLDGKLKSVPPGRREGDGSTRSIADATAGDAALELMVWQLLYADPLFELRWIASAVGGNAVGGYDPDDAVPAPPPGNAPGSALRRQLGGLEVSGGGPELQELLRAHQLDSAWDRALPLVSGSDEMNAALRSGDAELLQAITRALAAATLAEAAEAGLPAVTAETRDLLVAAVLGELGGQPRGIRDWLLAPLKGLAARGVTWYVARDRAELSVESAPLAGDVLLYQTRGKRIRREISERIAAIGEPVYLLAHSLGGIACVDLMVLARPACVRGLITVGSQAPLLYELDCLTSLRPPQSLPQGFPPWLNLFDPRDFLSYMAGPVFGSAPGANVADVEVRSGQPFPQSHSAYWRQETVWTRVVEFVERVENGHR
jgi:hypothetical protein